MTKPVIGITGANGFVGSFLSNYLSRRSYRVIHFARHVNVGNEEIARPFDLLDEITADVFRDIDVLIHCAFVKAEDNSLAEEINIRGTEKLVKAARAAGVKKIIFFSSVSAHKDAVSSYGKSKYRIHSLLDTNKDVIIQSGLVIGDGGLFKKIYEYTLSHKFIPLVDGGRQVIQLITIDDVASFIEKVIITNAKGTHVLVNNELLTYRQIFQTIAKANRKKIYFVPVPSFFIRMAITVGNKLGLRLPVSNENLLGFQKLRLFEPSRDVDARTTFYEKLIK